MHNASYGPFRQRLTSLIQQRRGASSCTLSKPDRTRLRLSDKHGVVPHEVTSLAAPHIGNKTNQGQKRLKSTVTNDTKGDFAVLGGGITGLSTAHYLTKKFPNASVTIIDSKPELGGWIRSTKVDVGNGEVLFEQGPRSLRPQPPNGLLSLRLAHDLGLDDEILVTPTSAPAARNRYIYYPDHLVKLPGPGQGLFSNFRTVLSEPAFTGFFPSLKHDWYSQRSDASSTPRRDISVGHFLNNAFGRPDMVDNFVSAIFHGIYAGDVYQLSAESIIPRVVDIQRRYGSLIAAFIDASRSRTWWMDCEDIMLQLKMQEQTVKQDWYRRFTNCSVFTFKQGIGQLVEALRSKLGSNNNVRIETATRVETVSKDSAWSKSKLVEVKTSSAKDSTSTKKSLYNHVISTLPSWGGTEGPGVSKESKTVVASPAKAVTVAVVNVYFSTPNLLRQITPRGGLPRSDAGRGLQGFGYLIPRSVPFEENPECALGVIFDSDISPDHWTTVPREELGTRLTVMMGGHWWDHLGPGEYPDSSECEEMALQVLNRHLGILEEPLEMQTTLQEKCIPQYHVGHSQNMAKSSQELYSSFEGKLRVAGSWYSGVGVNDCLRSAWDVVEGLDDSTPILAHDGRSRKDAGTGLETFADGRAMAKVRYEKDGMLAVLDIDDLGRRKGFLKDHSPDMSN